MVAIVVHPGPFYLVVGYSESLFLLGLLGYFYWCEKAGRWSWSLAARHGFGMTATRLVGLPAAVFPVWQHTPRWKFPALGGGNGDR